MASGVAYFKFAAVIFLVSGIIGLVIADQYIMMLDVDASAGGRLWGRAFGAVSIGFAAMLWMINPAAEARERRTAAIGAMLAFGLTGLGDIASLVGGDLPGYGWFFVVFNAVMAALAVFYLLTPAPAAPNTESA